MVNVYEQADFYNATDDMEQHATPAAAVVAFIDSHVCPASWDKYPPLAVADVLEKHAPVVVDGYGWARVPVSEFASAVETLAYAAELHTHEEFVRVGRRQPDPLRPDVRFDLRYGVMDVLAQWIEARQIQNAVLMGTCEYTYDQCLAYWRRAKEKDSNG